MVIVIIFIMGIMVIVIIFIMGIMVFVVIMVNNGSYGYCGYYS
jgi:hypothetical protein